MSVGLKDPADAVPVQIDWADWLAGGSIATSTWTAPPGVTVSNAGTVGSIARARVSGGAPGQVLEVTNTLAAASGEVAQRSVVVRVEKL